MKNITLLLSILLILVGCSSGGPGTSNPVNNNPDNNNNNDTQGTPIPDQFPYDNFGGRMTADEADAAQTRIEASIKSIEKPQLENATADELAQAYIDGLTGHPDIRLITKDPKTATVTLQMKDGTPYSIFTQIKKDGTYRTLSNKATIVNTSDVNFRKQITKAINFNTSNSSGPGDPKLTRGNKVYLLNTYNQSDANATLNNNTTTILETLFKEKNYAVTKLATDILDLKNVKDADVVWMNGHGVTISYQASPQTNSPKISLWAFVTGHVAVPCSQINPQDCASLRAGEAASEIGRGTVPFGTTTNWYATPKFYENNWTFKSPRSLVYIDACNGFTPGAESTQLLTSLRKAGAGQLYGWDDAVYNFFAAKTVKMFFDIALGTGRNYSSETIRLRPFAVDDTYAYMDKKGLTTDNTPASPGVGAGIAKLQTDMAPSTAWALHLVPTIQDIAVQESKGQIQIRGDFGDIQGDVTINGTPLTNVKWNFTEIYADIPATGAGSAGPVLIKINNKPSNEVPLTLWSGKITRSVTMVSRFGPPGIIYSSDCDIAFRADIHYWRSNYMANAIRGVGPTEIVPLQQLTQNNIGKCQWSVSGQGVKNNNSTLAAVSATNASPLYASSNSQFIAGYLELATKKVLLSFDHASLIDYQTFDSQGRRIDQGVYQHQFNNAFWFASPPKIESNYRINDSQSGALSIDPQDQGVINIQMTPQFAPDANTPG